MVSGIELVSKPSTISIYIIPKILICIFLVFSLFTKRCEIKILSIIVICFFMLKSYLNDRTCFFSFLECKLRNVPKEKGHIYNSLNLIYDENNSEYKYLLYIALVSLIYYNAYSIYHDDEMYDVLELLGLL